MERLKGVRNTQREFCDPDVIFCDSKLGYYNLENYSAEQFDLDFAIRSLCKIPRYIGHTGRDVKHFYSVAQHSVKMAESVLIVLGDVKLAKECLYHDLLSEPFTGDIVSPIKLKFAKFIKPIEERIERINAEILGIGFPLDPRVKKIDLNIAEMEMTVMVDRHDLVTQNDSWSPETSYLEFTKMIEKIDLLEKFQDKELVTEDWSHKIIEEKQPTIEKKEEKPLYAPSFAFSISDGFISAILHVMGFPYIPSVDQDSQMTHYLVDMREKTLKPIIPVNGNLVIENFRQFMEICLRMDNHEEFRKNIINKIIITSVREEKRIDPKKTNTKKNLVVLYDVFIVGFSSIFSLEEWYFDINYFINIKEQAR